MGLVLGESRGTKPGVFSGKVAPAGDERYLGCVTHCWCGFKVLCMCLCVCVVRGCFGVLGRRSHWNGSKNVAMLCCDVRR